MTSAPDPGPHICKRLSISAQADSLAEEAEESLEQKNQRETEELLALCEAAAEKWTGEFDSVAEIQQMRRERDDAVLRLVPGPSLGKGLP